MQRLALFALLSLLVVSACKKDDEEDNATRDMLVAKTWLFVAEDTNGTRQDWTAADCESDDLYDFRADNTLVLDYNDDTACGGVADEEIITVAYTLNGNSVSFTRPGGIPEVYEISLLTDTELRLYSNDFGDDYTAYFRAQ